MNKLEKLGIAIFKNAIGIPMLAFALLKLAGLTEVSWLWIFVPIGLLCLAVLIAFFTVVIMLLLDKK